MRLSLLLLLGTLFWSFSASAEPTLVNRVGGFESPESAFFDEQQTGLVFVTSMGKGGDAIAKNGLGTLSVLRANGSLVDGGRDWIKGLNSPKGVYVFQNRILIAEKDAIVVVEFQVTGGVPEKRDVFRQPISGPNGPAQLLNDLVVLSPGIVYATDTFANRIYKITGLFLGHARSQPPAQVKVDDFVSGPHLLSPNGIAFDGARFWVAGTDTFTGYGNFSTPIHGERGEVIAPANPELPMPQLHPVINPNVNLRALKASLDAFKAQAGPDPLKAAADAMNPVLIPDANVLDPRFPRMMNPTNSFRRPHHAKVYSIELATRAIHILSAPDGGFDGVAIDNGRILVGDFGAGKIMSVRPLDMYPPDVRDLIAVEKSQPCVIPDFCSNPADFSINAPRPGGQQRPRLLYVPNLSGGEVQTWQLD